MKRPPQETTTRTKTSALSSKQQDLDSNRESARGEYLTTNQGARLSHTDDSLKAGDRGPTLLEDFHFREKTMHFDHERIPERVVHARGAGAHGFFQVYESMAEYTKAGFLQDPSAQTPVFVRFSTVAGSRGSADTVRDARGFSTKFYTQEGVYDLVGNNMPIFFIQDAIKFADLVHAIKPEPDNEMPQAATAHDTAWDFFSLLPESTAMVMWILSDRALPRSFRMMEGFGIHTFRFINAAGKSRFVKFHWKPVLGMHSLVWDEAQKLAGKDSDWLRRDLWEAIEQGDFPEFEFGVQLLEEEDELKFDFDLLDPTKIWPEELVPVRRIGKMTLNRNPGNFFAETEQVAFHPGHVVAGIDVTNDPLLQGRLFSYLDTQLSRLGGPNFAELPINRPLAPVHNNQRDGHMRQTINEGKGGYFPNSISGGCPMLAPEAEGGYVHYPQLVEGQKVRHRDDRFKDFFSQATLFWKSLSAPEQDHLVEAAQFELGKVIGVEIRQRMLSRFDRVDHELATRVAVGIGVAIPSTPVPSDDIPPAGRTQIERSPALSMANTRKDTIKGRRIAVLAADGVDGAELQAVKRALVAAGAQAMVIAKALGSIKDTQGQAVTVDKSALTTASIMFDAVYIPGGEQSVAALKAQGDALHFVQEAYRHAKPIGASGAGIELLATTHLPVGGAAGKPSESAGSTHGVVTGRGDLTVFCEKFVEAIAQHRHWLRPGRDAVPA
ncbi:MAG TPA: catalase [Chloroflexota bacterium]|nr:catalase [Chloroflexota bacterium]